MSSLPLSNVSNELKTFNNVDFPEPDSPIIVVIVPVSSSILIPFKTH